jgi:hypothetical protein
MLIQDALPSGDAGCSGQPPAADGESFILQPPPADRSKTRHRSARNEEATPNHAPSQACALLGQSRQAPSISPPPNPPSLSLCTACRRKGAIFFFVSIRELKFTTRRELVDPGIPITTPGSFGACG